MYNLHGLFNRLKENEGYIIERKYDLEVEIFIEEIESRNIDFYRKKAEDSGDYNHIEKFKEIDSRKKRDSFYSKNKKILKAEEEVDDINLEIQEIYNNNNSLLKGNYLSDFIHEFSVLLLNIELHKAKKTTSSAKHAAKMIFSCELDKLEIMNRKPDRYIAHNISVKVGSDSFYLYKNWLNDILPDVRNRVDYYNKVSADSKKQEYAIDIKIKREINRYKEGKKRLKDEEIKKKKEEEKYKKIAEEKARKEKERLESVKKKAAILLKKKLKEDEDKKEEEERLKKLRIKEKSRIEIEKNKTEREKIRVEEERMKRLDKYNQEKELAEIELKKEQAKIDTELLRQNHELEMMKEKTRQEELKYLREQAQLKGIHGNIQSIKDYQKKGK